jgi:hypothetical protein
VTASELVEPAFAASPPYEKTLGPEVADLCRLAGFVPDPEQELGLDLIFAMKPDGRSAAFEFSVVCSRQNMKTGLLKMAVLGWLFITDQRLIVWSAHEFQTSGEAFRDLKELIEGCSWLDRKVKSITGGHGDEVIELVTGQRVKFKTRTKGGGRGLSGDKVVLDEAMFLQPMHMGALLPTLSARPDPQVLYGASAGLADSSVLRGVRDRGRAGDDPRLAYLEWCDDLPGDCRAPKCPHTITSPGCRLDDRRRWGRSNPAMGRTRMFAGEPVEILTEDYIAGERRALPPSEFGRERLGWWDDPPDDMESFLTDWLACTDTESVAVGAPLFGIDVSPGSRSSAIFAATLRPDGKPHLELVEHRAGVRWVAKRCAELAKSEHLGWVLDPGGPAGVLLTSLAEVGKLTVREMGRACEMLAEEVRAGALAHLGDPILTSAISGAGRRDIGDGMWAWSRKRSDVDIAPLVAATVARFGLAALDPPKPTPPSPQGLSDSAGPVRSDSPALSGF